MRGGVGQVALWSLGKREPLGNGPRCGAPTQGWHWPTLRGRERQYLDVRGLVVSRVWARGPGVQSDRGEGVRRKGDDW